MITSSLSFLFESTDNRSRSWVCVQHLGEGGVTPFAYMCAEDYLSGGY